MKNPENSERVSGRTDGPGYGYYFYFSVWLPAAVLGTLLVIVLVFEVALSWKAHVRLEPVNRHIVQMDRMQSANLELQRELLESLGREETFTVEERAELRAEIDAVLAMDAHLDSGTPQALADARAVLADARVRPGEALIQALSHLRRSLTREAAQHKRLIDEIDRATELELQVGGIALLLFPTAAALLIYLLRRRIFAPLDHLGFMMTLLGRKHFAPAPVTTVDPLLRPLTENYNAMVVRLAELEQEHEEREQDLQGQVEDAARVLLEQQRSLADTERLATLGEMTARIAHELRNPLAGVKLACTNLRQEFSRKPQDREYQERIDLVAGEIDRIISLLNSMLDQARHRPEPARDIPVAETVRELLVLARYQVPARIRIEQRIPGDLICRLPEALFRQVLLNLVLNARQALGEREGVIRIEAQRVDARLNLSVRDDGPGFPDELLEYGIRAFATHRAEGTGLGLYMVQRFARRHGGDVALTNAAPHGACVTLDLPCGKQENA
jgi:signal transduction histidine kinase